MADAKSFQVRLQNLPAELYNTIYDLTFTLNAPKTLTVVDSGYKPPSILQVNRHFRTKLACTYYDEFVFAFRPFGPDHRYFDQWLSSLSVQHMLAMQNIYCNFVRSPNAYLKYQQEDAVETRMMDILVQKGGDKRKDLPSFEPFGGWDGYWERIVEWCERWSAYE